MDSLRTSLLILDMVLACSSGIARGLSFGARRRGHEPGSGSKPVHEQRAHLLACPCLKRGLRQPGNHQKFN
jgi:hypothetical protein